LSSSGLARTAPHMAPRDADADRAGVAGARANDGDDIYGGDGDGDGARWGGDDARGGGTTTSAARGAQREITNACAQACVEVEIATRAAVSHREKSWALYGQARATMLALVEVQNVSALLDDTAKVHAKRLSASVLSRLHVGAAVCGVYGRFTPAQKVARAALGWKTNQKFEDVTRDLELLETQLWNLAGASGRVGMAQGGVAGDRRRRLLRGGVARTVDTVFGAGVLAMASAGSDGSELWWSTGGAFPRLDAYDMFLQGAREIEGLPKRAPMSGFMCLAPSVQKVTASSPIVAMANAPAHGLLWAGSKHGGVTIWDCDLGSLICPHALTVVPSVAVTCIVPMEDARAWIAYADGGIVEMRALTPSRKRDQETAAHRTVNALGRTIDGDDGDNHGGKADEEIDGDEFKVTRRIFTVTKTSARSPLADGTSRKHVKTAVASMLLSNGIVFVACEQDSALEVWDAKTAVCVRVEDAFDLGAIVSLDQHPTVTDLILSVHVTGAIQIWAGGACAVDPGTRVMTITTGFKSVDAWMTPFSKHFGQRVVGAVAVDRLIAIGHASGELTLWPIPGVREIQEGSSTATSSSVDVTTNALRSGKFVAHGSGLVQLTKIDGGGSVGVVTVGRFGSIMFWPLVQLESILDKVRQPALKNARRAIEPSTNGEEKFTPTRDATEAAQALANTSTISYNHIKLKRKVGEGSFGRVFHAVWNHTDVAVKFIGAQQDEMTQTSADLDKALDELEKEVGIMTQLRHPNIVLLLGAIRSPPAIVEEYCVRGSLYTVLQRHKKPGAPELAWRVRLQLALGAAAGMCYLHNCSPPILHRDLKSANLMVDRYFRVKVGDFNLSRVHVANTALSGSHDGSASLHSPRWMAPEVLQSSAYSKASDVYSYAIILWEIQTLEVPFAEFSQWQIIHAVTTDEERPDIDFSDGVVFADARRYRDLMRDAWAQDPAARPSFESAIGTLQHLVDAQLARDQAARAATSPTSKSPAPAPAARAALSRKSSSFTARRGVDADVLEKPPSLGRRSNSIGRTTSSTISKSRKTASADIAPVSFDIVLRKGDDDDDDVVVETPAASPEKVAPLEYVTKAMDTSSHSTIEIAQSVDILRGMRARNSLNERSALRASV
jgi:serine/threonine protein kinase